MANESNEQVLDGLKFDADGLIPAVVQDVHDGQVLMVAYMNRESLQRTLDEGLTCFWSRSRQEYWVKGLTSGNTQKVIRVAVDCDVDCLLVIVEQQGKGVACHTGKRSCFFRQAIIIFLYKPRYLFAARGLAGSRTQNKTLPYLKSLRTVFDENCAV